MPLTNYAATLAISKVWFANSDPDLPSQIPFIAALHLRCDSPDFPEEKWPLDDPATVIAPCGIDPNFSPLDDVSSVLDTL